MEGYANTNNGWLPASYFMADLTAGSRIGYHAGGVADAGQTNSKRTKGRDGELAVVRRGWVRDGGGG